ncbi:MAG: hypothetical protein AABX99_01645 [Nanoarchaeota archaeon]
MINIQVVKEYEIPGIGRVEIIHDLGGKFHGNYFARVDKYGLAGRYGNSLGETENRMLEEVKYYLEQEEEKLDRKKGRIKEGLEFITKKLSQNTPQLNDGEVN